MISHGLYLFNRYFVLLIHTTLDNEHGLFGCPTSCTLEKQRCDIFGSCRNKNKQQKEKETNETSFTIHFVDKSRHILVLGCSIAALVEIIDSVEHGWHCVRVNDVYRQALWTDGYTTVVRCLKEKHMKVACKPCWSTLWTDGSSNIALSNYY